MNDIITQNLQNTQINLLDRGFVRLVDCMPRLSETGTADYAIVQAARVSYGVGTKSVQDDTNLIRYLLRHSHTSPFEMVEFKFHCKMPIFVARQWIRHRTASVNEYSGRYSEMKDEFYTPSEWRGQSKTNKQSSEEKIEYSPGEYMQWYGDGYGGCSPEMGINQIAYREYQNRIDSGVSRELARICLPVSNYTEWYWKIDLKNLLDFLSLRCDAHAQYEIRVYADAMLQLITPLVPITIKAWDEYNHRRNGILLTQDDCKALLEIKKNNPVTEQNFKSKREHTEFLDKYRKIMEIG